MTRLRLWGASRFTGRAQRQYDDRPKGRPGVDEHDVHSRQCVCPMDLLEQLCSHEYSQSRCSRSQRLAVVHTLRHIQRREYAGQRL